MPSFASIRLDPDRTGSRDGSPGSSDGGATPDVSSVRSAPKARSGFTSAVGQRLSKLATQGLLIAGDVGAFLMADFLLWPVRPAGWASAELGHAFTLTAMAVLVFYASEKLYPGYRLQSHEHMRRRSTASFKVAALAAFGSMLLPEGWRLALAIVSFIGLALILQVVTRWLALRICRLVGVWGERAAIIAGPNRTSVLTDHFTRKWQYGIRPEPFSRDELARGKGPRIALIAGDTAPLLDELAVLRRDFSEVILLADTPNLKVAGLRPADAGGQIGLSLAHGNRRQTPRLLRRAIDLAIAIPAAVLAAPFVLIAGAAIYAIDRGPVFFWQPREGLAGKSVRVLKLRTMYQDAERRLEVLLQENPAVQAEWSTHFKLKQDPRILPVVGTLLRSTSFDELPQLFNVIIGEMGIVGPRPFPEYHLLAMNAEFRHKRRTVTPGLTGLWQISERSNADLELQRQLDEYYIDNQSVWFDWHILLSTIPAVFRRGGAY